MLETGAGVGCGSIFVCDLADCRGHTFSIADPVHGTEFYRECNGGYALIARCANVYRDFIGYTLIGGKARIKAGWNQMKRLRIDSTFKAFGAFWEYGYPDKRFTGSISSRKGVVELTSSPEYARDDLEAMRSAFAEVLSPPDLQGSAAICGFTQMNRCCTLLNPLRLAGEGSAHFPTMQKVNRSKFRAMRTVMGLHIESSNATVVDSAAYYLTKIHHVLPSPWQSKLTEGGAEHTVRNLIQDVFKCRSDYLGAEIVCEVLAGGSNRFKQGVKIKPVPRIKVTPYSPQSVDWFTALAFRLENFFSLILGTSAEISHVQLFQGDKDGWVIQKVSRRKEKVDNRTWVRCAFGDTGRALERWLSVPKDDQLVELTLLGFLRKSNPFQETEFLTLAQALEGFGRIRFGGTKRRKAKFDDLISQTYDLFTPTTAHQLVGERNTFIRTIIQTRDYYTHLGNPKGTSAAKTMKELFLLDKRLYAFLRGAMLIDLSIPESAFSEAIVYQATKWR
jgi:hypothetical protein